MSRRVLSFHEFIDLYKIRKMEIEIILPKQYIDRIRDDDDDGIIRGKIIDYIYVYYQHLDFRFDAIMDPVLLRMRLLPDTKEISIDLGDRLAFIPFPDMFKRTYIDKIYQLFHISDMIIDDVRRIQSSQSVPPQIIDRITEKMRLFFESLLRERLSRSTTIRPVPQTTRVQQTSIRSVQNGSSPGISWAKALTIIILLLCFMFVGLRKNHRRRIQQSPERAPLTKKKKKTRDDQKIPQTTTVRLLPIGIRQTLQQLFEQVPDDAVIRSIQRHNITPSELNIFVKNFKKFIVDNEDAIRRIVEEHTDQLRFHPAPTFQSIGFTQGQKKQTLVSRRHGPMIATPTLTRENGVLDKILAAIFPFYPGRPLIQKINIRRIIVDLIREEVVDIPSSEKILGFVTRPDVLTKLLHALYPILNTLSEPSQTRHYHVPRQSTSSLISIRRRKGGMPTPYHPPLPQSIQIPEQVVVYHASDYLTIGTLNINNPESARQYQSQLVKRKQMVAHTFTWDPDIVCFQEFPQDETLSKELIDHIPQDWVVVLQGDAIGKRSTDDRKRNRMALAFRADRFELLPATLRLKRWQQQGGGDTTVSTPDKLDIGMTADNTHAFQLFQRRRQPKNPAILTFKNVMGIILQERTSERVWVIINVHFPRDGIDKGVGQLRKIREECTIYLESQNITDYQMVAVGDFNRTIDNIRPYFRQQFFSFDAEYSQSPYHVQESTRGEAKIPNIDGIIIFSPMRFALVGTNTFVQQGGHHFGASDHPFKLFNLKKL